MKKLPTDILINFITLFVLVIITEALTRQAVFNFVAIVYLVQFVVIVYVGYTFYDRNKFFLSPSFIFLLYTDISFIIGAFLFSIGLDFTNEQMVHYFNINNIKRISVIFLLANSVILLSYKPIDDYKIYLNIVKPKIKGLVLFLGLCGFLLFSNIRINLNFLGGDGDFSLYPQILSLILIFYYLAVKKIKTRVFFYLALIAIFASTHYDSKRLAISLFFPILFLEIHFKNISIFKNFWRTGVVSSIVFVILLIFITSMSIRRGYGGFGVKNYFESFKYIPEYIGSDYFSKVLIANTEVTMTYFHSVDAINYVCNDVGQLKYGSTFMKVFFLPLPRSIVPSKPKSSVAWYTTISDPIYYRRGGSYPINIVSEFFLNFYYLFFIPLYFFFLFLNKSYLRLIALIVNKKLSKLLILLYAYTFLFAAIRGSGLDLFVLAILLVLPFYFFLKKLGI